MHYMHFYIYEILKKEKENNKYKTNISFYHKKFKQ